MKDNHILLISCTLSLQIDEGSAQGYFGSLLSVCLGCDMVFVLLFFFFSSFFFVNEQENTNPFCILSSAQ